MRKSKRILSIMTALAALSISMTSFAMTTEEFDKNTQLGLKLYNSGLYSQAKDELQKFCDKNWDTLNKGQQEYIQGYLNDAKQKSKQASKPKKKEIVGEVFVPLTTEEFDAGMSKGIDYFNRGLYYEAKDEFQWLYNGKWNNMNEGQRQYLSDYLSGTRAKIQQWESSYKNKSALINYAKENLIPLYTKSSYRDRFDVYYDVRFLFADFTDDGVDELAAVGVRDGELRYFKIFQYKDNNIKLIYEDHYGGYEQHWGFIARYNGKYFVAYDHASSSSGFLKVLGTLKESGWDKTYYSQCVYDWNNGGKLKGHVVNKNFVSESQYDNFYDIFCSTKVPIGDFCRISQLQ